MKITVTEKLQDLNDAGIRDRHLDPGELIKERLKVSDEFAKLPVEVTINTENW